LSKSQRKKLKKQRLNSGEAAPVNGSAEKKVQFAPGLEQGPTGSATKVEAVKPTLSPTPKSEAKTITLANGVTIQEHKVGSGQQAKKGTKLGIRYIGKLVKGGKEFDKNVKGKPFRFTLGNQEVIKGITHDEIANLGWDIGLEGIQLGGERKIQIPANMGYAGKKVPGIPANSDLVFDVKCVSFN
jgi:FK506-binding nuclear protein